MPRRTSFTRMPRSGIRRCILTACIAAATLAMAACDSSTGPGETARVSVGFRALDGGSASASLSAEAPRSLALSSAPVVVDGSNGTLTIDEVWLIVDELKLEAGAGACDEEDGGEGDDAGDGGDPGGSDESCVKFEAPPHLLGLLPGEDEEVAGSGTVAAGQFQRLKFEVKEPRDDAALQQQLATQFPGEWPDDAAGLVVGSFADGVGTTPFASFFSGEVKVELEFESALATADGAETEVVVLLDPAMWFANPDGTATNLALFDWETTGLIFDLEVKIRDGFTKIEVQ